MAPRKPRVIGQTAKPVDAYAHGDTRLNNPTEELATRFGKVEADEAELQEALYERDPSLDPQLIWRRKYAEPLDDYLRVQLRPIFTQEKIAPELLIKDLRRESTRAREAQEEAQINLFEDRFNGIPFEQKVEFYQHHVKWANRLILGDSLLVMASLAQKEGLKGKVQMIYMDPPYGIKFGSNWQVSTRKRDVKDGRTDDLTRQPEQIKAFRDTWELGIHSYLSYLRDRFIVARELLTDSGSIFVQIGDENVHLVRNLLDEVFGTGNFVALITFTKTSPLGTDLLPKTSDFILFYAKKLDKLKFRQLYQEKRPGEVGASRYSGIELPDGTRVSPAKYDGPLDQVKLYADSDTSAMFTTPHLALDLEFRGKLWSPNRGRQWQTTLEGMTRLGKVGRLVQQGTSLRYVRYLDDFLVNPVTSIWTDIGGIQSRSDPKIYVVQTSATAIQRCLLMTTDPGDLVLDPTCGSGTTAYVAEQWGRRWITTDTSRVALALARTRLMTAKYPYYLLADSPEGKRKEAELTNQPPADLTGKGDIRQGFVYRRVPHVTLKSIANNTEIDTIHEKWQPECERLRAEINKAAGQSWEEWEIPRPSEEGQRAVVRALLEQWWEVRRKRQAEIDDSIARHADQEYLYDKPYEDTSRIRVSGPFTVESLNPHRLVSPTVHLPESEAAAQRDLAAGSFERLILDKLIKQGVKGHAKADRIVFGRLDPLPARHLHATGVYMEGDREKQVAVMIGPETGTVTAELLREAAKEAGRGTGHDLLIATGFAFDSHASQMAQDLSASTRLRVQLVRMADDLLIRDEKGESRLKDLKSDSLFMAYGEPDIEIVREGDGMYRVRIFGLDVYRPATGEVVRSETKEIACWFLDTDYNDEAFFVRHAYFLGEGAPYEKLKKALKADIDEDIWDSCYSATSRPFPQPPSGKIAIKVINHYGDEVLQVRDLT